MLNERFAPITTDSRRMQCGQRHGRDRHRGRATQRAMGQLCAKVAPCLMGPNTRPDWRSRSMEKPHHRRHPKLDATDRRKASYENSAKRSMNNTVPKQLPLTSPDSPVVLLSVVKQILSRPSQKPEWWHFPLYESSYVGASNNPGTSLSVQVKALNWIGRETGEVTYTLLRLGGWKGNGWRTHLTQLPTPFRPPKEDD